MHDHPRDACGVVGFWNVKDAAPLAALALHALQHRGQESAGIVSSHAGKLHLYKGMGLVSAVFGSGKAQTLPGDAAIGHVRYSTAGGSNFPNAQPLLGRYAGGEVALGHNGNLASSDKLAEELAARGALFQTTTDSEIFLHMLAQNAGKACRDGSECYHGTDAVALSSLLTPVFAKAGPAFAVVMLFPGALIAARDPWGYRPLVLGRLGTGYVVASESCAFDQIGATLEREIAPGELIICDASGLHSYNFGEKPACSARCLLELVYFARPDSVVFGETPHISRQYMGALLAKEHPADVDIVVAIPDSGFSAAMGYANAIGVPLERGLIRNHYVGRSFIAPGQEARTAAVRMKHNVVREVVKGKRIALVDDSLIRGTTTATLGNDLRAAGAREVHLRIACPPTRHPCLYGVDFPNPEELLAHKHTIKEIGEILHMDSIGYLSLEGLLSLWEPCSEAKQDSFCTACWSGKYHR